MLPLFIFWIVESFVDKVKSIILLNIYSGFSLQKQSLQNVSNPSQIIQGVISGTYFRSFQGSLFGPQEGSETMFWPLFLNFE